MAQIEFRDTYEAVNAVDLVEDDRDERSEDLARVSEDDKTKKLPLERFEEWIEDQRNESDWRAEADKSCDYYDSNQLDAETLAELEEKGMGPLMRNMIKPTVDAVLGLEERTRTDWRVATDYDDEEQVATAMGVKLMEAERETRADTSLGDGYAQQVKAGFAAIEVGRSQDPFAYPYRVNEIHRREIGWDIRSVKRDWSDCRYLVRKRWFDLDTVAAHMPRHVDLFKHVGNQMDYNMEGFDQIGYGLDDQREVVRHFDDVRSRTTLQDLEWLDGDRRRTCIYECEYKVTIRGIVMMMPRNRTVEFDRSNPQHIAVLNSGRVPVKEAVYHKLRKAYFMGPYRLEDYEMPGRDFSYIPLWGYREDRTGAPYGLIRSLISPQDEINVRLQKFMWLLSSRRVRVDSDAVDPEWNDLEELSAEVQKKDSMVVMNPNRINRDANALIVDENLQLADAQHRAMQDTIQSLSQISGIVPAMMGQSTGGITANSALRTAAEQGMTTLTELKGNFDWARKEVGRRLLTLVRADLKDEQTVNVDDDINKTQVVVNRRVMDEQTGMERVENNVQTANLRIALSDVPSNPTYRQQTVQYLSEITKSLPEAAQQFVIPFILESMELPNRHEIAKLLREQMGITLDKEQMQQQQEQQAQAEQAQAEAEAKMFDANLAKIEAEVDKISAEADAKRAEIGGTGDDGQADQIQKLRDMISALRADQSNERMKLSLQERTAEDANVTKERIADQDADTKLRIAQMNASVARAGQQEQARTSRDSARISAGASMANAKLGADSKSKEKASDDD